MAIDQSALSAYVDRCNKAYQAIKNMAHGSQSACAFDIRVSPSSTSAVLHGYYVNERILGMIEKWIEEHKDAYPNPRRTREGGEVELSQENPS